MVRFTRLLAAGGVLALAATVCSPARADFQIRLTEAGFGDLIIGDNDVNDLDSRTGSILYNQGFGDFNILFAIGTSTKTQPGKNAQVEISALDVTNTGTAAKSIGFTIVDTGFTLPGTSGLVLVSTLAGIFDLSGGSLSFASYADAANDGLSSFPFLSAFKTPTAIVSFGESTSPTPFAKSVRSDTLEGSDTQNASGFDPSGPYSLAGMVDLSLPGGGNLNSFNAKSTMIAPAPDGIVLALSALPCLGVVVLRRRGLWLA